MDRKEQLKRQERTFLRTVGIQSAEYGAAGIPDSVYAALEKRAKELGINLDDLEPKIPRQWRKR